MKNEQEIIDVDNNPIKPKKKSYKKATNGRGQYTPVSSKEIDMQKVVILEGQGFTRAQIAEKLKTSKYKLDRAKAAYHANDTGLSGFLAHKDAVKGHLQANILTLNVANVELVMDAIDRHHIALRKRDIGEPYEKSDIIQGKALSDLLKASALAAKEHNNIDRLDKGQSTANLAVKHWLSEAHNEVDSKWRNSSGK